MPVNYNRTCDIIEITIRSFSGAKIESFSCDAKNKKKYREILNYIRDKYNFTPEIDIDESVNSVNWWE